jgi:uncharacterized protein YsxB (DUF464 family)
MLLKKRQETLAQYSFVVTGSINKIKELSDAQEVAKVIENTNSALELLNQQMSTDQVQDITDDLINNLEQLEVDFFSL